MHTASIRDSAGRLLLHVQCSSAEVAQELEAKASALTFSAARPIQAAMATGARLMQDADKTDNSTSAVAAVRHQLP